jgi:flagella basal body P-ring formation protein FlgA
LSAKRRLLVSLALVMLGAGPVSSAGDSDQAVDARVRAVVQAAVEARVGARVTVTLDDFACALASDGAEALVATPDHSGRTDQPLRFIIATAAAGPRGHSVRLGEATATVRVSGAYVRATHAMAAGHRFTAADLEVAVGRLSGLALRRVPSLGELLGARLIRSVTSGEPLVAEAVVMTPAVRAGDRVHVSVHDGGVNATVTAVAEQTAGLEQIIRVVNPSSRRTFRARVVAPGEVEVTDAP